MHGFWQTACALDPDQLSTPGKNETIKLETPGGVSSSDHSGLIDAPCQPQNPQQQRGEGADARLLAAPP